MKFSEKNIDGLPVFELEGKVMGETSEFLSLKNRLQEMVKAGVKNIAFDYANVYWMNSTGIGLLIWCVNTLREQGGDAYIVGSNDKVSIYFRITRLDTVLRIYEDLDAVLNVLSAVDVKSK
jgi:anti-anti-sigma factor